jgi:hypothetical protein
MTPRAWNQLRLALRSLRAARSSTYEALLSARSPAEAEWLEERHRQLTKQCAEVRAELNREPEESKVDVRAIASGEGAAP